MTRLLPLIALALLSACAAPLPAPAPSTLGGSEAQQRANRAARQFVQVVQTVEPVAERECRQRTRGLNCDFQIVIDDRADLPPNAFQTVDRYGRPILAFNIGMINSVRNADELAFVMGHEAAHHILDHLAKTRQSATIGAVVFAGIAAISGAEADAVRDAEQLGAAVGARTYSKEFELEADQLGTIITYRSGFDPLRGAEFFARIPDPGNRFLGSHPPNAARLKIVAETEKALRQQ
ncbi:MULTISPECIES: M48 family metallopeptidase [unclassified Mameliella]|uniref:M48 family metallopeptidase n=1 Tax=unclassified Mameliella TaxID=2630630 RepID=UPI00273DA994|nr:MULTISPECIES: M48 family metallopeptidase [unclassified Mameliella]